ncbi:exonuclease 3'-5' domain-containing protein 2 isoform X2 [Ambystoma mexicanum]
MASHSGLCVLVRLPRLVSGATHIPKTLLNVLANGSILKVGVGCRDDGFKLLQDYGLSVNGTVDLRYLAMRHRKDMFNNGLSLKSLSQKILNYSLDKSIWLRCSDWEAEELTLEQVAYAAKDAQISLALFLHLLRLSPDSASTGGDGSPTLRAKMLQKCQGLVDVPFKGRAFSGSVDDPNFEAEHQKKGQSKKFGTNSQVGVGQQSKDPRKHKRKPLGVGYSARKAPLYDNCFLHAPDGQPLCTCDRKKAQWYVDKGIGELMSSEPFIVKLAFEPSGRPESQVDYYLTVKENLCVVCGKRESYIRKNIVPHEYRRHFPIQMKDHNSHDVLLLCTACHAVSNYYDNILKQRLAEEFSAPIGCEEGVRLLEDTARRQVRSGARALLHAESLPEERKEELLAGIKAFYKTDEVTKEMLNEAAALETRICNESYVPHGLKVVQACAKGALPALMELEKRWRQHFLDSMQPKYLPTRWSVDHNHQKLMRKYGDTLRIELP